MASVTARDPSPSNLLHIYYDCEATGTDADYDRIIEVAAVVSLGTGNSTAHSGEDIEEFQSLCYTNRDLCPTAMEMTGLTNEKLLEEPRLPVVLERLLDWVSQMVERASCLRRESCTPVLVAHSGFLLDYPILMAAIEREGGGFSQVLSSPLYRKIQSLDLHFADSVTTCKRLRKNNDPAMHGVKKMKQISLYRQFFNEDYTPHRALNDAQALHRLLTESALRRCLDRLVMKSPRQAYNHWKAVQLKSASVKFNKGKALVKKGVYLEHMQQHYDKSPNEFRIYLLSLGIHQPTLALLAYFYNHQRQ